MTISIMFFQFTVMKKLFFGPCGKPTTVPNCLTVFSEALGLGSNWDHFKKLGAVVGFAPGLHIYQILALNGLFKLFFEPFAHVPGELQCLTVISESRVKTWILWNEKKLNLMIFIKKNFWGTQSQNDLFRPIYSTDKAAFWILCTCTKRTTMFYSYF